MKYREFGNTGITVSEIGIGTNTISGRGSHGVVDETDGIAAVQRAYELGVTLFDTAESYSEGRSEEVLGRVLGGKQDVVICSKVSTGREGFVPSSIRKALEGSLRRLRRDSIGIYLLHGPSTEQLHDPLIQEEMEALKREGLIRAYGASTRGADHMEQGPAILDESAFSAMEVPMNVTQREAADDILPRAERQGVGAVIRVPLGSGLLTGKYDSLDQFPEDDHRGVESYRERMGRRLAAAKPFNELAKDEGLSAVHAALAWVLTQRGVSVAIPGAKNAAQVEDNVAASDVTLSPAFLEKVGGMR